MDAATQLYLVNLGNPYAKLSVVDEPEADSSIQFSSRPVRKRRPRNQKAKAAIQNYLFSLEDPYAKLSVGQQAESDSAKGISQSMPDLLWKTKTEIHQFVAQTFALSSLVKRPPTQLANFADIALRLRPQAQAALHRRICSHTADIEIAHNRLSPKQVHQLLNRLLEMAYDAAALDAQGE